MKYEKKKNFWKIYEHIFFFFFFGNGNYENVIQMKCQN